MYLDLDSNGYAVPVNLTHPLELKFQSACRGIWQAMQQKHTWKTLAVKRDLEMRIDWLTHEITRYGFAFFPEMYVQSRVDELTTIMEKLNGKD